MLEVFYEEISSVEELQALANEMVAFAKTQPFDFQKATDEAKENTKVKSEMVGPMLRVHGDEAIKAVAPYNKYVRVGQHCLQLCYYEMNVEEGLVGQVTIVDNYKAPLETELVHSLCYLFLDMKRDIHAVETPSHVCVAMQAIKDETRRHDFSDN